MIKTKETTTQHYKKLIDILGSKYIKASIGSPYDFINIASKGINAHIIINFKNHFNIPREAAAGMLNISTPTIYKWVRENKKLERNFSVQLFELTDLFLYGSEIFKSQENFFKWLNLANTALGGIEPQELLEIPGGIAKVKDLLGRIEYGVYS
ncbi:MAG TPA: antitoxin Xre/MbcA/ParS toxin-binding domain-containing protein [Bacteroidia bacterium]|jgi:putative toxin-antitoxin system antitoxin component (TIGR02293 family)|nr:antitoxin Xre/MbcA/ParS toxin-binding domain-containing protein [Bacteroidia bacterium]